MIGRRIGLVVISIVAIAVVMGTHGVLAEGCSGRPMEYCSVNEYNFCRADGVWECRPCSSLSAINGVSFTESVGGQITEDKCFYSGTCSSGYCQLLHNGNSWCTHNNIPHPYHLEVENFGSPQCKPNMRSCSDFNLGGTYQLEWVSGYFAKSDQKGNATWDMTTYNKWDVSNCYLEKDVQNITRYDRNCEEGTVWRSGPELSGSAVMGFKIKYDLGVSWYYCKECAPGKSPVIVDLGTAFDLYSCSRNESGSQYLMCKCESVAAGWYSTGCTVNYDLNSNAIPSDCHRSCPTGSTTLSPGADSADDCVPNGTYCDQTGCFTLAAGTC
ncbi:MAG: hypothetical protein J6Y07_03510 [Alphaproteobacteria bacterium]|nr:hypothetical protein [Alphaproteobacteria bacterium]